MQIVELHEALQEYLRKKGIVSDKDLQEFLNLDYNNKLHDPFLFKDMRKAATRLLDAILNNEKILIYHDFDADGVPGAVLFYDFLRKLGYSNFETYAPDRNSEGYGFHVHKIEEFKQKGVKLIITIDVGISDAQSAQKAQDLGIDLIITDHHEAFSLPPAFAILNPKVDKNYPFDGLSGAAVAFKLVQATLQLARQKGHFKELKDGWEKWLLDLVAISTIADMVPIIDENRVLVHWGLFVLKKTKRKGLLSFFGHYRTPLKLIEEQGIAFVLAPKLNAASRMGSYLSAFELLKLDASAQDAQKHILQLDALNKQRQKEVAKITREARKRFKARDKVGKVFVTGDKLWSPSLLGLSAGKLADEFGLMVCLWGQDASGAFKGSCRNGGQGHVAKLFDAAKDKLEAFGGHEGAGGFTASFDVLLELEKHFNEIYEKLNFKDAAASKQADATLKAFDVNFSFYKQMRKLAPFGVAFEAPVFEFNNIEIVSKRLFGARNEHLEIVFKQKEGGSYAKAVAFFAPDEWKAIENINKIIASIEKSTFNGKIELRALIHSVT